MYEQVNDPPIGMLCDRLLQEWYARRETVDTYYRALRYLMLDSDVETPRQRALRRELSEKLEAALIAHRHASDQLQACEREMALAAMVR